MNLVDIDKLKKNLTLRGFNCTYFQTVEEALAYIDKLIPANAEVGFGGSMTVREINLLNALKGRTLLHRDVVKDVDPNELMLKMHTADWYVSSANAISMSGDIINIDGRGNRVAEILNGPKNVLIVAGTNKITQSIDEGIERTRNIAAPPNCKRLNKNTPCAIADKCCHCNSKDTICRATVIHHHPTSGTDVHVVLIDKNLGY